MNQFQYQINDASNVNLTYLARREQTEQDVQAARIRQGGQSIVSGNEFLTSHGRLLNREQRRDIQRGNYSTETTVRTYGQFDRIRRVLVEMPMNHSISLYLTGWSTHALQDLFANIGNAMFMVKLQMVKLHYEGTQGSRAQYISVFVRGDRIVEMLESQADHYGYQYFTLAERVIAYKKPMAFQRRSNVNRMAQSGTGFRQIAVDSKEFQEAEGKVFFPNTYSTQCFSIIVEYCLFEYLSDPIVFTHVKKLINESLHKVKGITTNSLTRLNRKFITGEHTGGKRFVFLLVLQEAGKNDYVFRKNKTTLKMIRDEERKGYSIDVFYLSKVTLDGKFAGTWSEESMQDEEFMNCLHYVYFERDVFAERFRPFLQSMERKFNEWICAREVSFEKSYQINTLFFREKLTNLRKSYRAKGEFYGRQENIACVFDIESFFKKTEMLGEDYDHLKKAKIIKDDYQHHFPLLIHYSFILLHNRMHEEELTDPLCLQDVFIERVFGVEGENCVNQFLKGVGEYAMQKGMTSIYVYGHNASGYDSYLCMLNAIEDEEIFFQDILITSRGILNLSFLYKGMIRINLRCTKCFLPNSLMELCINMNIPREYWKKDYDWDEDYLTLDRWNAVGDEADAFRATMMEYAKYDIYSLGFILYRIEQVFQNVWPYQHDDTIKFRPRTAHITMQGFTRKMLKDKYMNRIPFFPNFNLDFDKYLLKAMRGGMVQASTRLFQSPFYTKAEEISHLLGEEQQEKFEQLVQEIKASTWEYKYLRDFDANSLYPTAMKKRYVPKNQGNYLTGIAMKQFLTKCLDMDFQGWGIGKVLLMDTSKAEASSPYFPLLSFRQKEGLLYTWDINQGNDEGDWFTSDDLALFHKIGVEFHCIEGVFWSSEFDNMSSEYCQFIEDMYRLRLENYDNKVLNQGYKLAMNGAFGGTGFNLITTQHEILTVDENRTWILPSRYRGCAREDYSFCVGAHNALVKLKSYDGHSFADPSNKSTVTSCVLSAARRIMIESVWKAGEAVGLTKGQTLNRVHYMDTDSAFVDAKLEEGFQKSGLCHSELGGFKDDLGDNCLLLKMFSPGAKIRHMTFLQKKDGKWGLHTQSKLKGLQLTKKMFDKDLEKMVSQDVLDRNALFTQLEKQWCIKETKTEWRRHIEAGISTGKIEYSISPKSLMEGNRGKIGLECNRYTTGYILQRHIPLGTHQDKCIQPADRKDFFYFQSIQFDSERENMIYQIQEMSIPVNTQFFSHAFSRGEIVV